MSNIYNYVEKYGDELIEEVRPLDALVFARIAYIHIEELKEKLPFNITDLNNYLHLIKISSKDQKLINLLSKKNRYKDLCIERCSNIFDEEKREQFFAVTINLMNHSSFITFRGTNKSVTGLIEDLDMSYKVIPSQIDAIKYLEEENLKSIYLGGHSKGGNLAIYAFLNSKFLKRKMIKKVFNFDGPGLLEIKNNKEVKKIDNYYPECSIVGRILNGIGNVNTIKSNKYGIEGHNIYNWVIKDSEFEQSLFLKESDIFSSATISFLNNVSKERIKVIIDYLYELIKRREFDLKKIDFQEFKNLILNAPIITDIEKKELLKYIKVFIKVSLPDVRKKEK